MQVEAYIAALGIESSRAGRKVGENNSSSDLNNQIKGKERWNWCLPNMVISCMELFQVSFAA